jgi:GTP-binding protein Era
MLEKVHKAGFVSIIGHPNVGKSTLMNALVGERLSIISSKAQTTRHRIMGIISADDYQIVYSDTPGILTPVYKLQKAMMNFVHHALEDADVILYVVDLYDADPDPKILESIKSTGIPVILVVNKIDLDKGGQVDSRIAEWQERLEPKRVVPVSAMLKANIESVLDALLEYLPEHPAYFPKDELTDKTERFFAAEILREKIFLNYKKEVPYSCEVVIEEFKESEDIIRIRAEIYVERPTQKGIIIGDKGAAIKKTGTEARIEMEAFFGKKVFLEQFVKVEPDWRKKDLVLKRFGYTQGD